MNGGPGFDVYSSMLQKLTGLSPATIAKWAGAEGAYAPNGTGGFNYGNLRARGGGVGYSGVKLAGVSPGGFAQFASPADAARETAYWIEKMPNYSGVRAAAGKGADAELAAIAASPWDAGHYQHGFGAGVTPTADQGGGSSLQAAAPQGPDPRTTFALAIAQNIGSHRGLRDLDIGKLLADYHAGMPQAPVEAAPGAPAAPVAAPVTMRGAYAFPVAGGPYSFTDDWGAPRAGHTHAGIDIPAPEGAPLVAVQDGVITAAGPSGAAGNRIWLNGKFFYAHLSRFAVKPGDHVRAGQVIGYVGATGDATGPHLHFGWSPDASQGVSWANPYQFLAGLAGGK